MRIHRVIICCIMFISSSLQIDADEQKDIPNLKQPRQGVYVAGQPTKEGFKMLSARGVRSVINLRRIDEAGAREEVKEVTKLKMNYFHIPLTPASFSMEHVYALHRILENSKNLTVLVHCSSGSRAGGLWFVYRTLIEEEDCMVAIQEGRELGMKPELEEVLFHFVRCEREKSE